MVFESQLLSAFTQNVKFRGKAAFLPLRFTLSLYRRLPSRTPVLQCAGSAPVVVVVLAPGAIRPEERTRANDVESNANNINRFFVDFIGE